MLRMLRWSRCKEDLVTGCIKTFEGSDVVWSVIIWWDWSLRKYRRLGIEFVRSSELWDVLVFWGRSVKIIIIWKGFPDLRVKRFKNQQGRRVNGCHERGYGCWGDIENLSTCASHNALLYLVAMISTSWICSYCHPLALMCYKDIFSQISVAGI